ncbi:hydroxyacid dehydrogenase [Zunongwangia sp. SCSIO 43204]|uniref:D-3-phosphoglycerate dehydrogenase n=1 Tax=Zunongwangia mangrovi TaxID=1334022 RepID=A0A1I1D9C3_9FLAO|nr:MULTISPECIES: 2-hydroxyacid dehydrogenase [Zunongwangia]UAB84914.1 hydroxyacid dehydrogenase [Zunongwangia sp. SCSIO 43204]SFB71417.1 D-3-phosphoglycerate dehydrogenase [Zunongwangia mangrovi]
MIILHADTNHSKLIELLADAGHHNIEGFTQSREETLQNQHLYDGIVIRSRYTIDRAFLDAAPNLKFIARVGAGLENIDVDYAEERGVKLFSAPEGNRNAVGEHTLGMLLSLFNKLNKADREVREGLWNREENRGIELDGKTVGIIGYGNMGKAFARKLRGFDVEVLCYDIKDDVDDSNAIQVEWEEFTKKCDVVSLHTPWTEKTNKMVNEEFIKSFAKPFWFINTARGKNVVTEDLVHALKTGQVLGAGLDVLEYEKSSFESLFANKKNVAVSAAEPLPEAMRELMFMPNTILSPHVAGWTTESHEKLATVIANKIIKEFGEGDE